MPGDAIISIRPVFAEAILAGTKSVELRRRIPNLEIGTRLWIYATRPTAAIIGSVLVAEICRASPEIVWTTFETEVAISRSEFDNYFRGTAKAVAITLHAATRSRKIDIEALRKLRDGFHPPQVLKHLMPTEAKRLSKLASLPQ